jgi:hypothetical protein
MDDDNEYGMDDDVGAPGDCDDGPPPRHTSQDDENEESFNEMSRPGKKFLRKSYPLIIKITVINCARMVKLRT